MNIFSSKSKLKNLESIDFPIDLPKLELISIHIEKTAGTSFYKTLCSVYGVNQVSRLDCNKHDRLFMDQKREIELEKLKESKVIHGHFNLEELSRYINIDRSKVQVISWIREPIERLKSNYFHLAGRLKHYVDDDMSPRLIDKMMRSFFEFSSSSINQNLMHHYLDGLEKEELSFVGKTANYENDIHRLAEILNWNLKSISHHHVNKSIKEEFVLSDDETAQIKAWNDKDYLIWNDW